MENLPGYDSWKTYGGESEPDAYVCPACGEPATECDPAWRGETYHLLCIDTVELKVAIEAGDHWEAIQAAVQLFEELAALGRRKMKRIERKDGAR